MSNRNFDNRVIIQRLQNQVYSRNLYTNNINSRNIINNPQNTDSTSSRFDTYRSGAQTEYFRGLLGNNVTISPGGIIGIPPYPSPIIPPIPSIVTGGSMNFDTDLSGNTIYVQYPNNDTLKIGENDFTIEWYQYWTGIGDFPRPFSMGSYGADDISIAMSYEGTIYFWIGMVPYSVLAENPPLNEWTHMAIVGTGGNEIKFFMDGILKTMIYDPELPFTYNFTDGILPLTIGNENNPESNVNFTGQITNFRWVIGTAVYTSNFTPPTIPLTNISGTKLLLLAKDETNVLTDSSNDNRTPNNNGVTYSSSTPF
jgi:hypothetical protein